ncbi:hypothetical protein MRX96_049489 [Rhipicephalus microplus]
MFLGNTSKQPALPQGAVPRSKAGMLTRAHCTNVDETAPQQRTNANKPQSRADSDASAARANPLLTACATCTHNIAQPASPPLSSRQQDRRYRVPRCATNGPVAFQESAERPKEVHCRSIIDCAGLQQQWTPHSPCVRRVASHRLTTTVVAPGARNGT